MSAEEVVKALKNNNLPYDGRVVKIHKNYAWMQTDSVTFIEIVIEYDNTISIFKNFKSVYYDSPITIEQGRKEWYNMFGELIYKLDNIKKLIDKL